MRKTAYFFGVVTFCILSSCLEVAQNAPKDPPMPMSFFITSAGPGDGGNLGGLAVAALQCLKMATAGGAGDQPPHPPLRTPPAVHDTAMHGGHHSGDGHL